MKESLARIHVHELPPEAGLPIPAANDNVEVLSARFISANDNELLEKEQLAALQERLGIVKTEARAVVREAPEEVSRVPSEEVEQSSKGARIEMMPGHASIESAENQPETAQAARGAEQKESSSGGNKNAGGKGSSSHETSRVRSVSPAFTWLKRLLKAPFYLLGAVFAFSMTAVIKSTNKIFDAAKLTKGGSGGGGSKPSGGRGVSHGGGGHH